MSKKLYQWNYEIKGLIPEQVRLKRKLWLKKDEILLQKKNKKLLAYVLSKENDSGEQRVFPYLWMSCLISSNAPELSEESCTFLASPDELGKVPLYTATVSVSLPDVEVGDIEQYAPKFLRFIGKLHDRYIDIVKENDFLKIALKYFYEAEKKFVYNNEGFISAMISMEALFSEGSSDIKYKLSHRAAFVLGLSGLDSLETFKKLKVFYKNRSKLIHGEEILKHDPDRFLVSKYTRRALIIFMILLKNNKRLSISVKKRKEEILQEIDNAMLDKDIRKSLKNEISKGLKDFNLKIPRTFEGEIEGRNYRVTAW
jgi:hypothetical protein